MLVQLFKIPDLHMNTSYPYCLDDFKYGTNLFWAEEYWAIAELIKLEKIYPNIDFSGLIDENFKSKFSFLLRLPPHVELYGTSRFTDLSRIEWENNRKFINIATSHAPSRFIAKRYSKIFGNHFGIISIDAHLDMSNTNYMNNKWIDIDLATKTIVIGGWDEVEADITNARPFLAFFEPNIEKVKLNSKFTKWLSNKKIYLTLDLDYFSLSQLNFMGYSNYWHRERIIGHSKNFRQILEEEIKNMDKNDLISVRRFLGLNHDLESFIHEKKISIKSQSEMIVNLFESIVDICRNNSATLLSVDLVEYSPICDFRQLTIKEVERKFTKFSNLLSTVKEKI